jgi:hypothetical protein
MATCTEVLAEFALHQKSELLPRSVLEKAKLLTTPTAGGRSMRRVTFSSRRKTEKSTRNDNTYTRAMLKTRCLLRVFRRNIATTHSAQ